ncbi:alcohol dehydrogenase [acceptor]-like [Rhodnius prolixus]|uniref:alcohol dehydrogenase [acceptor]-like n=1 Tax=Rhodnius prolixus TaxID=13249 RepID=UPI003D18A6C5
MYSTVKNCKDSFYMLPGSGSHPLADCKAVTSDQLLTTMNITTFFSTMGYFLSKYYPEQLDLAFKPKDSSGCTSCRKIKFDFIVVGAGSAGCVVANRLSANPNWKVLLIEAGDQDNFLTDIPAMNGLFAFSKYDWNYTSIKQEHGCYGLGMDGYCLYVRGRGMGGCSTVNHMMYVRGVAHDYDLWEKMGNPGWDYRSVLPYFLKAENMTIPELSKSPYHSTKGPLKVSYPRYWPELAQDIVDTRKVVDLPELDYNGPNQNGAAHIQFNVDGSTRCSSAKAYIYPIKDRPNLYIFMNTLVTKVLFSKGPRRRAIGVSCITGEEKYNVYASKEVILSAGSVNTPKLLMLSGVGPRDHLEELNIEVYADLPNVGLNLVDHPVVILLYQINSTEIDFSDEVKATNAIIEYARDRKGVLSAPTPVATMFFNTSNFVDTQIVQGIVVQGFGFDESCISFYMSNLQPNSSGSIRLNSSNYIDPPLIDPNLFENSSDKEPLKLGLRQMFKIISSSLKKYSLTASPLLEDCDFSDPDLENLVECCIKYYSEPGGHPIGTAKMGPRSDKTTVVDPHLKVHTIDNLRVIDASVMPTIPSGNTNAAVYMLAEKGSEFILNDYS